MPETLNRLSSTDISPSFGFDLEDPAGLASHDDDFNPADSYHYAAGSFLSQHGPRILAGQVPRLTAEEGVWHPSGFIVFRLGRHASLGALRLHVWPDGERIREERGRGQLDDVVWDGDIHDHAWFVDGLSIAGYEDKLYDVWREPSKQPLNYAYTGIYQGQYLVEKREEARQSEAGHFDKNEKYFTRDEIAENGLYRIFNAFYRTEGKAEVRMGLMANVTSEPDGGSYSRGYDLESYVNRKIDAGDLHSIDPGTFHAPTIPGERFAATLAFNSPRVTNGPHVMIGGAKESYLRRRVPVTEIQWQSARDMLMDHIKEL